MVRAKKDAAIRKAYGDLRSSQESFRTRLKGVARDLVKKGHMIEKKANDYWQSNHEIFARSFDRYIQRKLENGGQKNTYLSGLANKNSKTGKPHPLWPTDEEVDAMSPAFDQIFAEYRKHKYGSDEPQKYNKQDVREALTMIAPARYSARMQRAIEQAGKRLCFASA